MRVKGQQQQVVKVALPLFAEPFLLKEITPRYGKVKLLNANLQVKGRRGSPGQVRVWTPLTRPVDSISTKRHLINGLCNWWHNTSRCHVFQKRRVTGAEQSPTLKRKLQRQVVEIFERSDTRAEVSSTVELSDSSADR